MLVIKRIHVQYTLMADADVPRDKIERVMGVYHDHCPVYRSISGSIAFSDSIDVVTHS